MGNPNCHFTHCRQASGALGLLLQFFRLRYGAEGKDDSNFLLLRRLQRCNRKANIGIILIGPVDLSFDYGFFFNLDQFVKSQA